MKQITDYITITEALTKDIKVPHKQKLQKV